MKHLRKLFFLALLFLSAPQAIYAAENNPIQCGPGSFANLCNLTGQNIGKIVTNILNFAFFLAIIIALGFLIYGGIKWIVSGGEKAAVEEARNHIIAALIGLVVVFLSYFIINIVVQFFVGTGLQNIQLPTIL